MSAHTPGPWEPLKDPLTAPFATTKTWLVYEMHEGSEVVPAVLDEANAHLIAAAPDLYEAAARLVEHFSDSLPDHLVEEFRAAIAKAVGK